LTGRYASPPAANSNPSGTYTYDLSGNLISNNGTPYTYDALNRLSSVGVTTYKYDTNGKRIHKTAAGSPTQTFIWSGDKIVYETDGTPANDRSYRWGASGLLAFEKNGKMYVNTVSWKGDILNSRLPDSTASANDVRYAAFGTESWVKATPFGYNSEYKDPETGFQYLGERYYMPELGRFTQEDPAQQGTNLYIYCGNDPVNRIDPSGLWYKNAQGGWVAERGDTLWGLAARPDVYGDGNRWREFGFKRDPRTLQIGEVIKVGGSNGGSGTTTQTKTTTTPKPPAEEDKGGGGGYPPSGQPETPEERIAATYTVYSKYSEYKKYINRNDMSAAKWGAMASEAMGRISFGVYLNIWIGTTYPNYKNPSTIHIKIISHATDKNEIRYQVWNSSLITNKGVMLAVIDFIINYNKGNPLKTADGKYTWNRTREQMLKEWEWHNDGFYAPPLPPTILPYSAAAFYYLYVTKPTANIRYQHVDFDNADYGPYSNLRLWGR